MREFFEMLNPATNKRVKGAITILLLILMTPFVTLAFAMLELGRYQNTVDSLDEAMGISTMSLLANYDKYLQDRFGLYACTQSKDLNSLYQMYLTENLETLRFTSDASAVKGVSVTGVFSLGDKDVFRKQIDEYMMLNGPYTMASEFLNLGDLLGCFDNLETWTTIGKLASDTADVASDGVTMAESAEEVKETSEKIANTCIPTYDSAYTDFNNSVNAYITAAATPRPTDPPANASDDDKKAVATQQADYDKALATLEANVGVKKTAYSNAIQDLIYKLEEFKENMTDYDEAAKAMIKDTGSLGSDGADAAGDLYKSRIEEIEEKLKDPELEHDSKEYFALQDELIDLKTQQADLKTSTNVMSGFCEGVKELEDINVEYDADKLNATIASLRAIKTSLNSFDVKTVTSSLNESDYHITIEGYISPENVDAYFEEAANSVAEGSFQTFVKGLSAFFQKIIKFQLIYDPAQSAKINTDFYAGKFAEFNYDYNGPSVETIINDIFEIFNLCDDMKTHLEKNFPNHPIKLLIDFFSDIIAIAGQIVKVVAEIYEFVTLIVERVEFVLSNPVSVINSTFYATYNMSCRTGEPVMGKQSDKAMATVGALQTFGDPLVGGLTAFIDGIAGPADDYSFCGCELEYILFGCYTEIGNQTLAFFALYLLRLIIDVAPIMLNEEVEMMAAAAAASTVGVGEVVVYLIEVFCEPLVDTLLLVNGSSVPLIKKNIYLTPAGMVDLISAFTCIALSPDLKQEVIDDAYDAYRVDSSRRGKVTAMHNTPTTAGFKKWAQGFFNLNYRDHMLIFMLITTASDPLKVYERIANIVIMEETQYLHSTKKDNSLYFDLNKAYTVVKTSATVTFNPVLAGNDNYSNNDSSFFTISRAIYRGY